MRLLDALFGRSPVVELASDPESGLRFAVDGDSIDPAVFGLTSFALPTSPAPRVDRRSAMQVPAVKGGRDLICNSIGGLPLATLRSDYTKLPLQPLLDQPEPGIPRSVTMANTVEDMLFEGNAWWRITARNASGWPVSVRRLNARSVYVETDSKVYLRRDGQVQGMADEWIPDADLIRFYSPTDGLLSAGARAIRTCLKLDAAAAMYADEPMPLGYFSPAEGVDPDDLDGDVVVDFLGDWASARQVRATAYVGSQLKYNPVQFNPEQIQLAEQRNYAVLEIARAFGLDPEDLAASTGTSRTYFNAEQKRKDRVDFVLGGFIKAIQDRLSMGDVTPRGQFVRFDLDDFLKSDTLTRYQGYDIGLRVGAISQPEIREREELPPLAAPQEARVPALPASNNVRQLPAATSSANAASFADDDEIVLKLDAPASGALFSVDLEQRTITGLAVPYGKVATHGGLKYQFTQGSIAYGDDVSRIKLFVDHDKNRAVGYATKLEDTADGLVATFKVGRGPAGDEALLMAEDHIWDGLSGGFRDGGKFALKDGIHFAQYAPLREISLTPVPAFDDARVSAVALTADTKGTLQMTDTTVSPAEATPDVSVADQVAAELAKYGLKPGQTFSSDEVSKAIQDGFASLQAAAGGPAVIPAAGGTAQFSVNEELPYRFDGSTKGEHCFTDDLRDSWMGSQEAKTRLETFMDEAHQQFAVTTTNVAGFNPTQNRPELYVPQLGYQRPLWDLATTGTITDITPFTVPKFSSASGLAGAHTQGTEPTPGAFAATVQTVTPTAISGKVEINREVWDQGGNPQTDTIVWQEMQRAYFEGIETNLATLLNGLTASTLYTGAEINLAGAADAALETALKSLFVGLQFVRGGNRYTAFAADGTLYAAIVGAKDSAGRSLFPLLGPTNANGTVAPVLSSANVLGQTVRPAWALSTGNAANSYLFVPESVWAWASAPKRFTFEYQVKSVDMAVWGYTASAVLRNSDVARIDATTADS